MAKYSLSKYILTISIPSEIAGQFGASTISVGGEGSYLDSISISYSTSRWNTKGDATGSWVHEENLDRTGSAAVTLNQLSDKVAKFIRLCNLYYNTDVDLDGLTLELNDTSGNNIATCNDCVIKEIPNQDFGSESANQEWVFNCGKITFNS